MIYHIDTIDYPGLEPYNRLTEQALRNATPEGLFIAESPKVIRVALSAGYKPESLLCEERHIAGDAADIIERFPEMPVYTGSPALLEQLTGYRLTRGVLCAMRRKPLPEVADTLRGARIVAVLDNVCDTTNIGAIFRSAAALGVDAVLLTSGTCDPLNRRAVRVSMGTVFLIPWTYLPGKGWQELLHANGLKTAAMALTDRSVSLDDAALNAEPRLAVIMGTEGDGLAHDVIGEADYTVRIPMAHNVDSLNVAAASAVAFWQLRR